VLGHLGGSTAELGHFDLFRRVYDAFALIRKMGVSAKALIQATTNEPTGDTVRDFQAALRARYDANSWRDVVRPINDEMLGLQRDALVAYILHQMRSHPESAHIDTPDKLFEYFLMDVQMDSCMQTSRVRHALSSVQLFIERCLMNLEPRVSPAAINAKQWEWMKRYRVWEANRKLFLWPENWLEPELRDAILQGDDERIAAERHHRGARRNSSLELPLEARGGREAGAVRHLPHSGSCQSDGGNQPCCRPHHGGQSQVILPPSRG